MRRAAALALLLAACAGADERPATIDYLAPAILRPSCATSGCHDETTTAGRLRLDDDAGAIAARLVEKGLVNPGYPDESPLVNRLTGDYGGRMPPDGPLPRRDIELIERWILGLKGD